MTNAEKCRNCGTEVVNAQIEFDDGTDASTVRICPSCLTFPWVSKV
jgi:hypothetical protein